MSNESMSAPATAAKVNAATTAESGEMPEVQDLLAEKTLAMIGGAPREEMRRLEEMAQAQLARNRVEAETPPVAPNDEARDAEAAATTTTPADPTDAAEADASESPLASHSSHSSYSSHEPDGSEAAVETQTQSNPETGAAQPTTMKEPERFRFQNAEDRAVAQIAKAKGISLVDAARVYAGEPASVVAVQEAQPVVVATPAVAQLEAQVGELERRLDASSTTEGLWNPQIAALVKEHSKAAAALQVARLTEQQAAESHRAFETEREAALAETVKQYPDLGNRDTVLWKVAAQLAREAHDPQHPDHVAGQQVEAPRYFADKAAAMLKIKPFDRLRASRPAEEPSLPTPQSQAARPGPASGTRQTLSPTPEASAQQRVANAQAKTLAMIGGARGLPAGDEGLAVLVL